MPLDIDDRIKGWPLILAVFCGVSAVVLGIVAIVWDIWWLAVVGLGLCWLGIMAVRNV